MDFFYDLYYFIKRLIAWIPVLWKDREWDHAFLYDIIHFKLSQMEKHSRTSIMVHERVGKQIRYAMFLIDRIREDDYHQEEWKAHNEKWGELRWDSFPAERKGYVCLDIHRPKARAMGMEELERAESSELWRKAGEAREKDLDRLFRHMRKYVQGWWV